MARADVNGPLGQNFHHLPKFVNERSHYVSPYHSDSAIDSVSASNKRVPHRNSNQFQMPSNGINFPHQMMNTPIPELMPTPVNQFPQQQPLMNQCMPMENNNPQMRHQMQPSFIATPDTNNPQFNMPVPANNPQMNEINMQQQAFQNFQEPQIPSKKRRSRSKGRATSCQSDSEILERSSTRSLGTGSEKMHSRDQSNCEPWDKETVITDATSNKSSSVENIPLKIPIELELDDITHNQRPGCCDVCMKPFAQVVFILLSIMTPIAFAVLPRLLWVDEECSIKCIGSLVSLLFRLLILVIAVWAIFFRKSRATLPAINLWKAFLLLLLAVVISISWAFYGIKIFNNKDLNYDYVLGFAISVCDCLIFIHYLAVVVLEIKQLKKEFIIKVVRNTDGESRFYSVGQISIQHCASWVLEKYYNDFPVYNPYLMTIPSKSKSAANSGVPQFKLYNIDGVGNDAASVMENSKAMIAASARNRDSGRNTRFYEEQDFERRLRKRRARLIVAVEEAFMHIKRPDLSDKAEYPVPMDAEEAAEAIFPSMARALQKYLKISRQTHCYSLVAIKDHLARCISLEFTPRAFLERYLTPGPVITSEAEQKPFQNWDLITDTIVNKGIHEGLVFQLKQDGLSLIIYVAKLPKFHIREETIDPNQGRFVLRLQSETSV